MGKLTTKARAKLAARDFAGPGRSYPVENKSHAIDAKARASEELHLGNLSKSSAAKIDAKANKVIGGKGDKMAKDTKKDTKKKPMKKGWPK